MDNWGGGLASLAFWGFVAACVVSGVWDDIKKREVQHETLRRLIESGKPIDPALLDKVLGEPPSWRGLRIGGIVLWTTPWLCCRRPCGCVSCLPITNT